MINRTETLIKRAAHLSDGRIFPDGIDFEEINFEKSAVEEFDYNEFVILRSADDILSVFQVDKWQVERLPPERWPDYVLEEAKLEG